MIVAQDPRATLLMMPISVLLAGDPEFRSALASALGDGYGIVEVESVASAADALLAGKPAIAFVDLRAGTSVAIGRTISIGRPASSTMFCTARFIVNVLPASVPFARRAAPSGVTENSCS